MRDEAKKSLFEYIEFFCNSKRVHSTIIYFSTNELEGMCGILRIDFTFINSSKYALSSIVCGGQFGDICWGYQSIVLRCVSRLEEKGSECTAPTINEETLQTSVVKAINELLTNKESFIQALQKK